MPPKLNKSPFARVGHARDLLRERAVEILEQYLKVVKAAEEAGDFEVATKSLQWLMEHMPDDNGQRVLNKSVDKEESVEHKAGPSVRIGIQLGGLTHQPKSLPEPLPVVTSEVID